ncbi:hypothetical protein GCM10023184_00150 [Flaviaesturariibacter amylovorans]|uniref:Uncharacterized protein n=2 Tax=Flaviaesturariibacter amylovorans TaxID=1084520 RepID=A0ABP8G4G0_9BACT
MQTLWAFIAAVPKEVSLEIDEDSLPWADGNPYIWKLGHFELDQSEVEIICWDGSYTIVKFRTAVLPDRFKEYFPEALPLSDYE